MFFDIFFSKLFFNLLLSFLFCIFYVLLIFFFNFEFFLDVFEFFILFSFFLLNFWKIDFVSNDKKECDNKDVIKKHRWWSILKLARALYLPIRVGSFIDVKIDPSLLWLTHILLGKWVLNNFGIVISCHVFFGATHH